MRKTPLAIRFMKHWLKACEDERIIAETPSAPSRKQKRFVRLACAPQTVRVKHLGFE